MGLTESKVPFETDGNLSTPIKKEEEIGICPMWDPRSPTVDFERTPVLDRNDRIYARDENIGVVSGDPRSPSCGVTRTPIDGNFKESSTTNDTDSELRLQLERLQISDGCAHGSTENLGNISENTSAVIQQKTILKLMDDENMISTTDSLWLPNTPPCPRSQSTPQDKAPYSPVTPDSCKRETDGLIKQRQLSKKNNTQQGAEKLQKKVLKKALTDQVKRSPLAERNGIFVKEGKTAKSDRKFTAIGKYRKYNSLDESFNDSLAAKENTVAL